MLGSLSLVYIPNALAYSSGSVAALFILSLPLFYFLYKKFGWKVLMQLVLTLSIVGLAIEYIGLVTGLPYGQFVYTGHLGYKLFGILPWTVGLSWMPLVIGSVALAYTTTRNKVARILLPIIFLVAFDLLLDPLAVHFGMWSYVQGGAYYGVPLQNFFGWIVSGFIGSAICYFFLNTATVSLYELGYSFLLSIVFWSIIALKLGFVVPLFFGLSLIAYFAIFSRCRRT